jgi:Predicted membrane protein (DUF2254)
VLHPERTLEHDVAYGVRLLVDIAERSIAESPMQDPTTTVQAIDRLHDIVRQLAGRTFPDGHHRDEEGVVRLSEKSMSWDDRCSWTDPSHSASTDGRPFVFSFAREAVLSAYRASTGRTVLTRHGPGRSWPWLPA